MISEGKQIIKHTGGRPKKAVTRKIVKGIRYTTAEYFIVKQQASKAGMAISLYIRQMSMTGKVTSRINEEERQIVRELVGQSNNLNQLAKKGNQGQMLTAVLEFEKYRNIIDELLEKLRK